MPFQEVTSMSLKREFIELAHSEPKVPIRELCRRYRISAPTAYKWLNRYKAAMEANYEPEAAYEALVDRSRRPLVSPTITAPEMTEQVLQMRRKHPAWGGRKITRRLRDLGHQGVPSPSTATAILQRNQMISPEESSKHKAWIRFEREAPNLLWQMDFKGDFILEGSRARCYPLTVLDDHSRFALGLRACADQQFDTVQGQLTSIFQRYGLPEAMTMDNGSPWGMRELSEMEDGGASKGLRRLQACNRLTLWLLQLSIRVSHSRPYHPQTQGKDERFHRTLKAEVLAGQLFRDHAHCQKIFDPWRHVYNSERPHEALQLDTPSTRYSPSTRAMPATLPSVADTYYYAGDAVRKVQSNGAFSFHRREFKISRALRGYQIALRPTSKDGFWQIYFCRQLLAELDLRVPVSTSKSVNHVSEHV